MSSAGAVRQKAEPRSERFRFFISYAKEDQDVATAVSNAIQTATGASAEVFMDTALQFGVTVQEEIKKRLDETNVLIIIDSGVLRSAFSYPGLELGYFLRIIEGHADSEFPRRIVPIFVEKPPGPLSDKEGINIGISRSTLNMTVEAYEATLVYIDLDNAAVKCLSEFQEIINRMRESHKAPRMQLSDDQRDLQGIVTKMQLAIFNHLKTSVDPESTLKPQYQFTVKTTDAALRTAGDGQLPDQAVLTQVGLGKPLSAIFGLQQVELSWEDFKRETARSKFRDSWADAITKVVTFSMQNQLAKDNSQVILSYDERCAYRVILTTGLRKFNGDREFNIYFVECLRRGEFGDPKTTALFQGLELACHFRSLFLEEGSKFSSFGCRMAKPDGMKEFTSNMERELNLLRRDALEAGLDDPTKWVGLVDLEHLVEVSQIWRPLEARLRELLAETRRGVPEQAVTIRESLVAILEEVDSKMRPLNAKMIAEMADKLKTAAV